MYIFTVYLKGGASFDVEAHDYTIDEWEKDSQRKELKFGTYDPKSEKLILDENYFIDADEVAAIVPKSHIQDEP
ncbi:hypothetical protein HUU42_10615 [bacterium]|nr:hypothetical protein [bacterium]